VNQSQQVRQALGAMRPDLLQALWDHYKLLHNVVYETQHRGDSPGPITGSKNQDRTGDAVADRQDLRHDLERAEKLIIEAYAALSGADKTLRSAVDWVGAYGQYTNGHHQKRAMRELHRRARRGPYAGSMAKKLRG
jgi:hypothetical protein